MARMKMMLIDTSKCIGCKACQIACQQWHKLPAEDTSFTGSYQNPPDMSSANLTVVKFYEVGSNGNLRWLFFVDRCRHCKIPLCKPECPFDAIVQTAKGFVVITGKCKPRRCSPNPVKPCQLACPFKTGPLGMPRYQMSNGGLIPGKGKANKCDFCYDRWRNNLLWGPNPLKGSPYNGTFARSARPACELACPTGAITTGRQSIKRQEAKDRVSYLKANGVPNANVYPRTYETQVIWVLQESIYVYGLDPY